MDGSPCAATLWWILKRMRQKMNFDNSTYGPYIGFVSQLIYDKRMFLVSFPSKGELIR
jgi:hypothetical protein